MKEVGVDDSGVGKRGSIWTDVGGFIYGKCSGSPGVWVRDVSYVTAHWEYLGQIPPQGGTYTDGESTTEGAVWYVRLTPNVWGEGGGAPTWGGDLRLPPPEHSLSVHQDQVHYGPVSFGRYMPRDKGFQAVVGAGGPLIGGEADGGLVGGTVE